MYAKSDILYQGCQKYRFLIFEKVSMLSFSLLSNDAHNIFSLKRKKRVSLQSFCCFLAPSQVKYLDVMSFYIYL